MQDLLGVQWYEGFECIRLGTLGVSYFWWNRKTRGTINLSKKSPFVKTLFPTDFYSASPVASKLATVRPK